MSFLKIHVRKRHRSNLYLNNIFTLAYIVIGQNNYIRIGRKHHKLVTLANLSFLQPLLA